MPKTTPVPFDLKQEILKVHYLDPKRSARRIAKDFGLHRKTVGRIIAQGGPMSVGDTESLPGSDGKSVWEETKDRPEPVVEEQDELTGEWVQNEHYVYNGTSDTYVTFLRCRPKPLVISGSKFRSMKKSYSNWDGNPSTVNEICRRFAIPRDQFMELRATHGWTHESEPFTREDVMSREVEDLADDAFQQRRQAIWESFEKKRWHQIKTDAEKWNNLEQNFVAPLQDHLSALMPNYDPPRLNIKSPRDPFAVVTSAGELHYGGGGWMFDTGEEFNRKNAEERLVSARESMLTDVADRGRPEVFEYVVGNDFFTVDNDQGGTTKQTPQDLDGNSSLIFAEGVDLSIRDVDTLRSVAPVRIRYVPGNHDRLLSLALLKCLEIAYRGKSDVEISVAAKTRTYATYGNTCLGYAHGDGKLRPSEYMATMLTEAPAFIAQTVYRAFFTGHLHHEVVRELTGGTHYQMSSLRGLDRYHERNAYLADAALSSYIVDKHRSVTSTIMTRV